MNGTRDCAINEHVVDFSCPRFSETKDWNHIVKCRCTEEKRNACLSKLRRKLEKEDDTNEDFMKINKIVSDMSKLLNNETIFEKKLRSTGDEKRLPRNSVKKLDR